MPEAVARSKQRPNSRHAVAILGLAMAFLTLLIPAGALAGYDIHIYHLDSITKSGAQPMMAVVITPLNGRKYHLDGIDFSSLGVHVKEESVLKGVAKMLIAKAQEAYYEIAQAKGLFKNGDAFHQSLMNSESYDDGRSAIITLYEGHNFARPVGTFRVSYATHDQPSTPMVSRLSESDAVASAAVDPLITLNAENIPADLWKVTGDRMFQNLLAYAKKKYPNANAKQWMETLMSRFQSGIESGAFFTSQGQQKYNSEVQAQFQSLDPLFAVAMSDSAQDSKKTSSFQIFEGKIDRSHEFKKMVSEGNVKFGGPAAEMKGLGNRHATTGADYMFMLFALANAEGFFDFIPARLGLPVPATFLAETTPQLLEKAYPTWGFQELTRVFDIHRKDFISIVKLARSSLGNLLSQLFLRAAPDNTISDLIDLSLLNEPIDVRHADELKSLDLKLNTEKKWIPPSYETILSRSCEAEFSPPSPVP